MGTLKTFSIRVDKTSVYVPKDEFEAIKDALVRASKLQMDRGKRSYVKIDPAHDAQMYYWITSARRKRDDGGISLGYDRYLLTLDGSLTQFANLLRIPLTETFFIYPNQWYELAFPFLRIRRARTRVSPLA